MRFMKILFPLATLLVLSGCAIGTNSYYILSVSSQPKSIYHQKREVIGVENVTVPGYLYKREIAIANSSNQITLLSSAKWGEDLDSGLTNRLIGYLQKKFNNPEVYNYPWDMATQPDMKLSVHISRFIAQGEYVYLDASWSIESFKTSKHKSNLFSTKVATNSDTTSVVDAMNRAFSKFEETIATSMSSF